MMKARTKRVWERREEILVLGALLVLLVPSAASHGQSCNPTVLESCSENEVCKVEVVDQSGICQCLPDFTFNAQTNECEEPKPPPDDSPSHLSLGLGLGITTIVLVLVALAIAHRRYGILSGVCRRLPTLHLFGKRGEEFVVDSGDDDSPIV
ncbi:uncharacterized protein LOC125025711 [Penaeus chinensis]|uniref:uncharacterized protein LOC125025711 n=1 Tax=Penaeus chinensis TaxID=139456 RepID=UPI001FB8016F|nr:uncharacterized protein LOC125025711 [Penaeus chinensis]